MKILLLSKKFPYPLRDGEAQAIHGLSKSLSELGAEVSLLAMNTSKHRYQGEGLPSQMSHYKAVRTVEMDTDLRYSEALKNLIKGSSYHISRFDAPAYHLALKEWLTAEKFDVIQLETLYLAPYLTTIRKFSRAVIAMRAHNVEFEIWERVSEGITFSPKRWYLQKLTQQLKDYELKQLNNYDLLLPITKKDEENFMSLGFAGDSQVVPIGLDTSGMEPDYNAYRRPPSLSFIGSLDWAPNLEGLQWFLKQVWPSIHQEFPQLEFHVAGRNMPDSLQKLARKNVHIHGEVESAATFVNQHSISIVPLLSGSGMRAKILEAMQLGRTIVTTSVGIEGIEGQNGKDVLIADNTQAFIKAIQGCVRDYEQLEQIGRAANATFVDKYDRMSIAERLLKQYYHLQKSIAV
ncbi:MAG: glycosyltransferase family 4 protein [Bacteroidota bacterium]